MQEGSTDHWSIPVQPVLCGQLVLCVDGDATSKQLWSARKTKGSN